MHYVTGNALRRFAWFYFFVAVISLSLISCAKKSEHPLVGKWQEQSGREVIEFMKTGAFQGTMIWDLTNAPVDVNGAYVVKGDLIDLTVANPANLTPMTWKIAFSGSDELTMVFQQGGALKRDGNMMKYQRIKQ